MALLVSQAANAVTTVATKLGTTIEAKHRNVLIDILTTSLAGRTWNGKDKVLKALASICKNSKEVLVSDPSVEVKSIVDALIKEARKDETVYKTASLQSLGDVLESLDIDRFEDVYVIVRELFHQNGSEAKDDDVVSPSELAKKREDSTKLREVAFETLGKAWPMNSKATQEKYREVLVEQITECLPKSSRSVQACIVSALYSYVDKLSLLDEEELDVNNRQILNNIIDNILKTLNFSFSK